MKRNQKSRHRIVVIMMMLLTMIVSTWIGAPGMSYELLAQAETVHEQGSQQGKKPDKPVKFPVTGIALDRTELRLKTGEQAKLKETIEPARATNKTVVWTSSDPGVAAVNDKGKVTGLRAGTTTVSVTAVDGGKSASATVYVSSGSTDTASIDMDVPDTVGAGEYITAEMTVRGSTTTESVPVHYVIEKLTGDGDMYWSADDRNGEPVDIRNSGAYMAEGFTIPAGSVDQVRWNVKFSKIGDYSVQIRVEDAVGQILATDSLTISVTPFVMDLGPQVFLGNTLRGAIGHENGKAVGYTVITSSPDSRFVVIDIETERVVKQFELYDAEGSWSIWPASSGKVYIGTYTKSKLFEYDPVSNQVVDLHGPMESVSGAVMYQMAEDKDGKIYFGVYPESRVFRFDPVTRQYDNLGRMASDQFYARSMVYDPDEHALFIGVGGNRASLIKYDIATGSKSEMLPDTIRSRYNLTYDLNLVGNRLFVKTDPNYGLVVIDKRNGALIKDFGNLAIHSSGVSPKSPYAEEVFLTYGGIVKTYDLNTDTISDTRSAAGTIDLKANVSGWGIVELGGANDPGHTLVGFPGTTGGFFKYNLSTKTWRMVQIEFPKVPLKLHTLASSSDGNIYAAGFLPGGMGIFDPEQGISSTGHTISQVEGMAALGNKMYFGVYPGAKIYEYDTTKPWKLGGSGATVIQKFELKPGYQQDRAYAMLGVPELNKLFIGTVPDYAVSGGALTVYDPAKNAYQAYRHIVQDQSVIALAYKDGIVYGGTSYVGGMGKEWPYADGRLFAFDVSTGQKLYDLAPVPGKGAVQALLAGPDGNIWGFAQGTFFVFDPVARQVVYTEEAFPGSTSGWRDPQLQISVKDGHVYGTIAGDNFFRIDKNSREITVLEKGASLLAQDSYGNFYFKLNISQANLSRYTIEDNTVAASRVALDVQQADLYMDETLQLKATVVPSYASQNVVWSTSDSSVAQVGSTGVVTPVSPGTAAITVTTNDGTSSASAAIRVKERVVSRYEISLDSHTVLYEQSPVGLDVTVKTSKLGKQAMEQAHYVLEKTAGTGTATFTYTDRTGAAHTIVDSGIYGSSGLSIPAQTFETMNWSVSFSSPGSYAMKAKLVDSDGNTTAEATRTFTVQQKPDHSIYRFRSTVSSVVYDVYGVVPVELFPEIVSGNGYKGVKLSVEKASPEGNVWFELNDSGRSYSFLNRGEIRGDGFDIGPAAAETMPWSIRFDRPGAYTLRWKMLDLDNRVISQSDQIVVAVLPNAVPLGNAGFEIPQNFDGSVPHWSISALAPNQTVWSSGVLKYEGDHSLRFTDGSNTATMSIQTVRMPVVPGKTYQGSILLYNTGPSTAIQFYLQFFDSSGTRLTPVQFQSFAVPSGQWTPMVLSAKAPDRAATVNILVYSTAGAVLAGYLDEATLTYGD